MWPVKFSANKSAYMTSIRAHTHRQTTRKQCLQPQIGGAIKQIAQKKQESVPATVKTENLVDDKVESVCETGHSKARVKQ